MKRTGADAGPDGDGFNLSGWALEHRSFMWFLMLVSLLAGVMAYRNLGREEDPPFAIKTMVVEASWPGATVSDMTQQVTDRIEKEVQQIDALDYTKSYTTPGKTTVFVQLKDGIDKEEDRRGLLPGAQAHRRHSEYVPVWTSGPSL